MGLLRPHFERWLDRRLPPAPEVQLDHRRIFIFPTAAGFLYLGLVLLLVVTAINYQNNAIYMLAFLLGAQFIVAIFATYTNLAGLQLRRGLTSPGFAGDRATFRLRLQRAAGKRYLSLRAGWPGQAMALADLDVQVETVMELYHSASQRGRLRPGRLLLETVYPFGLLRAWTWLNFNFETWVYPRPLPARPLPVAQMAVGHGQRESFQQREEFTNIRPWRKHDAPRQVLWKAYAKQQPLMTMEYTDSLLKEVWIDESLSASGSLEGRLSAMCYAALQLNRQDVLFGLRFCAGEVAQGEGEDHLHRVLTRLARCPGGGVVA